MNSTRHPLYPLLSLSLFLYLPSLFPSQLSPSLLFSRRVAAFLPSYSVLCIIFHFSPQPCLSHSPSSISPPFHLKLPRERSRSFENSSKGDESNSWIYLHNGDLKRYAQIYLPTAYDPCLAYPSPVPYVSLNLSPLLLFPYCPSPQVLRHPPLTASSTFTFKKQEVLVRLNEAI